LRRRRMLCTSCRSCTVLIPAVVVPAAAPSKTMKSNVRTLITVAMSRPVQAVGVKYYVAESESRGVYFIVRESESTAQLTL
jgi:hypothetical protein